MQVFGKRRDNSAKGSQPRLTMQRHVQPDEGVEEAAVEESWVGLGLLTAISWLAVFTAGFAFWLGNYSVGETRGL